jgi:hypothetical protein
LLVETEPWHRAFYQRLKDALHPTKLPPLQLTSKPVAVADIWSDYKRNRLATPVSILAHVVVIGLLTITFGRQVTEVVKKQITVLYEPSPYDVMLPPAAEKAGGGGGGGDRSKEPESKGKLPKLAMEQKAPPAVVLKNPEP